MSVAPAATTTEGPDRASLGQLVRYFLYLGTLGFGGPVALVGFMHRDLVERRRWIDEDEYRLGVALAQIMPGPLAAQLAIALGYFQRGGTGGRRGHRAHRALVRQAHAGRRAGAAPDPRLLHQGRRLRVRQRAGDRALSPPGRGAAIRLADRAAIHRRRRRGHDHAGAG